MGGAAQAGQTLLIFVAKTCHGYFSLCTCIFSHGYFPLCTPFVPGFACLSATPGWPRWAFLTDFMSLEALGVLGSELKPSGDPKVRTELS